MAPRSSPLAWKIPWMEEPGRLQSMGLHRVRHNWSDLAAAVTRAANFISWSCPIALSFRPLQPCLLTVFACNLHHSYFHVPHSVRTCWGSRKGLTQTDLENKEADMAHVAALCRDSVREQTQLQCSESLSSCGFHVLAISWSQNGRGSSRRLVCIWREWVKSHGRVWLFATPWTAAYLWSESGSLCAAF